ncbi:MAG: hypothetical protein ABJC89_13820 [Acidobacteriota bacterium]
MPPPNKTQVVALQRNAAALLKLLGGDNDDRLRFWEIFKGITTPVEAKLIDHQIAVAAGLVDQVSNSIKVLQKTAGSIQG